MRQTNVDGVRRRKRVGALFSPRTLLSILLALVACSKLGSRGAGFDNLTTTVRPQTISSSGSLTSSRPTVCPPWSPETWACRADALREERNECRGASVIEELDRCSALALAEADASSGAAGDPNREFEALLISRPRLRSVAAELATRRLVRARLASHPYRVRRATAFVDAEGCLRVEMRAKHAFGTICPFKVAPELIVDDDDFASGGRFLIDYLLDENGADRHAIRIGTLGGVDSLRFTLRQENAGYDLIDRGSDPIPIPREWMEYSALPEELMTASDRWGREVHAIPLGDGRLLLHFLAYDIQRSGSGGSANGRDLFLVWSPIERGLSIGSVPGFELSRGRYQGCWSAVSHDFSLADIDGDGVAELGVVRESIRCTVSPDQRYEEIYHRSEACWHKLTGSGFSPIPDCERPSKTDRVVLRRIGLESSPVEFVLRVSERARRARERFGR